MSDIVFSLRSAKAKDAFTAGLHFAATPVFAIMALVTALGGGQPDMLCAAMPQVAPFGGMIPMYLLMSAFHAAPWLKLIFGR